MPSLSSTCDRLKPLAMSDTTGSSNAAQTIFLGLLGFPRDSSVILSANPGFHMSICSLTPALRSASESARRERRSNRISRANPRSVLGPHRAHCGREARVLFMACDGVVPVGKEPDRVWKKSCATGIGTCSSAWQFATTCEPSGEVRIAATQSFARFGIFTSASPGITARKPPYHLHARHLNACHNPILES